MKNFKIMTLLLSFTALVVGFNACSGSSTDTTGATGTSTTGSLALYLTDAPADYKSVFVTIKEVQVHLVSDSADENSTQESADSNDSTAQEDDASWKIIAEPNKTYDLLTLQNGVLEKLGVTELEAGKYTQVRLILSDIASDDNGTQHPFANYIVFPNDDIAELEVSSGLNTGIKLNHPFDIESNTTTNLIMDFVADKSIHQAGNKWMLNPVIGLTSNTDDMNESNQQESNTTQN